VSSQVALPRTRAQLRELAEIALRVLPEMWEPDSGLFSHKTLSEGGGYVNLGPNVHYSAIALVGLLEQQLRPPDSVVGVGRSLDALHTASAQGAPVAVLGNLLWACALAEDGRARAVVRRLVDGLRPSQESGPGLGSAAFGLTAAARAFPDCRDQAHKGAERCVAELLRRFSPAGDVFRGMSLDLRPRRSTLERGILSFAAQVYPLHGLAAWYASTGSAPARELSRVAGRLAEAQGPRGQWWWLYSPWRRQVVEGYPVYSVHQDGMAFLGLAPLGEIGLDSHWRELDLGLRWIFGENELATSLVDHDGSFISRCIQRVGSDADGPYGLSQLAYRRVLLRSLRARADGRGVRAAPAELEILRECRSYHLGWILCAHALAERAGGEAPAVDRRNAV
jgi:hypothetical protein